MQLTPRVQQVESWLSANGGEDGFFELVAEGLSWAKIAKRMGVSQTAIHAWLDVDRDRRRGRVRDARAIAGHVIAEKAGEPLEQVFEAGAAVTSAQVSAAKSLSEYQRWLAGVYNRDEYGERQQQNNVNLNFSFGDLFLSALQQAGHKEEIGPVVEAELLPPGEGDEA